jgi:hypothetical protein
MVIIRTLTKTFCNEIKLKCLFLGLNKDANFCKTDFVEIEGFLAATILMTIIVLPAIRDYWTHERMYGQKQIKSIFSRNRYRCLLSTIHLVDNETAATDRNSPDFDRLYRVRPMINILNDNFQALYTFGCYGSQANKAWVQAVETM